MNKKKGYTIISNLVLTDDSLTGKDKLVYWAVKSFAHNKDWSIPGEATLHELTGVSQQHISKHTSHLEERGYMRVERRGGQRTNKYWLTPIDRLEARLYSSGSHSQGDDSQLRQDDSHLRKSQGVEPADATTGTQESASEEGQVRNTSGKKQTERPNSSEERESSAALEVGPLSLQESETHGVNSDASQSEDDGARGADDSRDLFQRSFTATQLLAMLKMNQYKNLSRTLSKYFLDLFVQYYSQAIAAPYILVEAEATKAESQAHLLVVRFLQYIASRDCLMRTLEGYGDEMEQFVAFAFRNVDAWAYRQERLIGNLLSHFNAIINKYARVRSFQISVDDAVRQAG